MSNVEFTARRTVVCSECGDPVASANEREKLASMRGELLQSNWAYWHDDPAILFLSRLLRNKYPPFVPDHMKPAHQERARQMSGEPPT